MQSSQVEADYLKLLEEKRQYLLKIYPLGWKNLWEKEASNKDVVIHSQIDKKTGLKIIRATTRIRAPKEKIIEVVEDVAVILEWDKTMDDARIIHKTDDYYVLYTLIKKVPLIDQRESVFLGKFYHEEDGTILGVGTSIDHPDVPKKDDKVRATAYLVGWVLKPDPNDPNVTDYTLILHINPQGWIPSTVFNWFAHSQGFGVKPFGDFVEKKWKESLEEKKKADEKNKISQVGTNNVKQVEENKENHKQELKVAAC